jgi:hypothetical protein
VTTPPLCRRCRERPSTGALVELCDPCFDAWEAEVHAAAAASPDGRYALPDAEVEYLSDRAADRRRN